MCIKIVRIRQTHVRIDWVCTMNFIPPSGPKRVLVLPYFSLFCPFFEKRENAKTVKLAKVSLAKVGHPNFGQSGQLRQVGLAKSVSAQLTPDGTHESGIAS